MNDAWVEESAGRAMRYDILTPQSLRFYYCLCYPSVEWWFQVDLLKN